MAHSSASASLVSESQVPLGRVRREAIVASLSKRLNRQEERIRVSEKRTTAPTACLAKQVAEQVDG